ncbi:hypothetical protein AOQ84DRAFT_442814 [Glonium stellatum]|uniref:Ubiquitin-like domain-containing protein n=1 Tax=Glonium stellatum TaxID=574774 RepID=A0A8E2JN60_9PEZI|nr:hypothetical protein AOQ84DRAFT_442814 [Glonium stellatum]
MAFHAAAADIPLLITSPNSSSERRITPSWSIAHFKTRLEPITGIPASAQKLTLRVGSQDGTAIEADDEEKTQLSAFPLQAYAEINVLDTRPPSARTDFSDLSAVPKYTMPSEQYETRNDSVLAWKKAQKLGRFDPSAPSLEEQKIQALEREVEERAHTHTHTNTNEHTRALGHTATPHTISKGGILISLHLLHHYL